MWPLLWMALKILDHYNFVQHLVPFLWSHHLNIIDKGMGIVGWGFRCVVVSLFCGIILTLFFILVVSHRHLYIFFLSFSLIWAMTFHMPLVSTSEASSFGHAFVLFSIVYFEAFTRSVTGVVSDNSHINIHCIRVPLGLPSGWTS